MLRAEPGAQVALGLKPGITLDEFRRAIEETRAEELLNWVDVFAGDMLYVAAGTVHTIGGGMVLVETQQTSDITYRLYDYGRPRELHIEDGLQRPSCTPMRARSCVVAANRRAGALAVLSGGEDAAARADAMPRCRPTRRTSSSP